MSQVDARHVLLILIQLGEEKSQVSLNDTVESFVKFICETIRVGDAVVGRMVDSLTISCQVNSLARHDRLTCS